MAETLHFALLAASDGVPVTKPEEIAAKKAELLREAETLRQDAAAAAAGAFGPVGAADAGALDRAAARKEAQAASGRPPTDPLMVKNDRGDPVTRGVQIIIAAFLEDRFGDRLYGTAAALTGVALGLPTPSARVSQSAFSGPKKQTSIAAL